MERIIFHKVQQFGNLKIKQSIKIKKEKRATTPASLTHLIKIYEDSSLVIDFGWLVVLNLKEAGFYTVRVILGKYAVSFLLGAKKRSSSICIMPQPLLYFTLFVNYYFLVLSEANFRINHICTQVEITCF